MNANRRASWVASVVALAALSLPSPAHAGDAAAAEALFNEARRLMSQGNFAAACPQLEESQRQDPGMGTLYNLGDCYEKTGKVASAWAAFLDVAAQAKAAGQAPREADARARAAALEPKLSRLTLAVEGPAATTDGLTIKRGNVVVGKAQWGLSLPVDPGEHVLEISAPGKKPMTHKLQVAPNGASVRYAVPALEDAPASTAPADFARTGATPASGDGGDAAQGGQSQRTLGLVIGGVGVVGVGLGAFFGLRSMSLKSDGDAECKPNNDNCSPAGVEARNDALSAGTMSTVFFAAGAAVAATGAVLYLTAPKGPRAAGTTVVPVATAGGGALLLRGSFQ